MFNVNDYKTDGNADLAKVVGKKIKYITGYISTEFGDHSFKLGRIFFEDGTFLWVEGEHDFPYVVEGDCKLDDDLMAKIRNAEDE